MNLVRREFLRLAGALAAVSAASPAGHAQSRGAGPIPTEILRRDLLGQDRKVEETLVTTVAFPPGAISTWHVHPGAQELVFVLEGRLILETEGEAAKGIMVGDVGLIPGDIPHTVRNETADQPASILVVYSRSDKNKPLRVDVRRS